MVRNKNTNVITFGITYVYTIVLTFGFTNVIYKKDITIVKTFVITFV